jgi:hypothetical protein
MNLLVVATPSKDASLHVATIGIRMPLYSIIHNAFVATHTERMTAQTLAIWTVMSVGVNAVDVWQIPFTSRARLLSFQRLPLLTAYTLAATKITPSFATWTMSLVVVTPSQDASLHVAMMGIRMPVYSIIHNAFVAANTERISAQTLAN